jgi:hypothetical protein
MAAHMGDQHLTLRENREWLRYVLKIEGVNLAIRESNVTASQATAYVEQRL